MERLVAVAPGVQLWTERLGPEGPDPLLLVMGANASGLTWPDPLITGLAQRHPVIRYDHRDTGRSTWAFDENPYGIADLAGDAVAVLDGWGVDRAHVVGMSMGGTLVQLMLLDHPDRLLSATLVCSTALGGAPADGTVPAEELPGPAPALLRMWQEFDDPRDERGELRWRVEHWRLLNGAGIPFNPLEFRAVEERILRHTGHPDTPTAHVRADPSGLDRAAELAAVTVPTLVVEAPFDPVNPPPHAEYLADLIDGSTLVEIPGMGHALPAAVVPALTTAILEHTAAAVAH